MAKTNKILGLVGPPEVGDAFGNWLDVVLSHKNLKRATVASAYLTEEAAEHLLACCYGQPAKKRRPVVTVLVGVKDRFTRKAAIQRLLKFAGEAKGAKGFPVDLRVLCPRDRGFHVKALVANGIQGDLAVLGSHNLTGTGLDSVSELGIVVSGPGAKEVDVAIARWSEASTPWTKVLKTYKEAKLPAIQGQGKVKGGSAADVGESPVAQDVEADRPLTQAETKALDAGMEWYLKAAPKMAKRVRLYQYESGARDNVLSEGNYYRGAVFSFSEDYPGEAWRVGQKRAVMRVLDTIPIARGKACMIAASRVAAFKVTPEIRRVANKLGIIKYLPEPTALAAFVRYLKSGELPSAK